MSFAKHPLGAPAAGLIPGPRSRYPCPERSEGPAVSPSLCFLRCTQDRLREPWWLSEERRLGDTWQMYFRSHLNTLLIVGSLSNLPI
jgi:hypothetical protein